MENTITTCQIRFKLQGLYECSPGTTGQLRGLSLKYTFFQMAESLSAQDEQTLLLSPVAKSLQVVIPEADEEMKDLSTTDDPSKSTSTPSDSVNTEDPKKKKHRRRESSSERAYRKKQERREKRKKEEEEERRQREQEEKRRHDQWRDSLDNNERKGKKKNLGRILT